MKPRIPRQAEQSDEAARAKELRASVGRRADGSDGGLPYAHAYAMAFGRFLSAPLVRIVSTFAFRSRTAALIGLPLAVLGSACGIAPHSFKALSNPAAIVRARSVAYGDNLPEWRVVPPLIERLNDTDPVVRLSAHEELRRRTGQDFGYVPWAPPGERRPAVERWKRWWEARKAALASHLKIP